MPWARQQLFVCFVFLFTDVDDWTMYRNDEINCHKMNWNWKLKYYNSTMNLEYLICKEKYLFFLIYLVMALEQ